MEETNYQKYKNYYRNYMHDYMRKHPHYSRDHARKLKREILVHYGGNPPKCSCCGETHIEFLTIDHIKGDGAEHRKQITGDSRKCSGQQFHIWLIRNNFPKGFQVLCSNCNMAKGRSKIQFCPVHYPKLYRNL